MATNQSEERVLANIVARKAAQDFIKLAPEEYDNDRFWETLATLAAAKVAKVVVDAGPGREAMTDVQAKRFEQTTIPRGAHKGEKVGEVECGYWASLADDEFSRDLKRYVASEHFRKKAGVIKDNALRRPRN